MLSVSSSNFPVNKGVPFGSNSIPPEKTPGKTFIGRDEQIAQLRATLTALHPSNPDLCNKLLNIFDGNHVINFDSARITAKELETLSVGTWKALSNFARHQTITQIFLPPGLNAIPRNLRRIFKNGELKYVSIPEFQGKSMNLLSAGIDPLENVDVNINIDGASENLRSVLAPTGCHVYGKNVQGSNKVNVCLYSRENATWILKQKMPLGGHSYAKGTHTSDWREKLKNLNGDVQFQPPLKGKKLGDYDNRIVCRHLALAWIYARRNYLLQLQNKDKTPPIENPGEEQRKTSGKSNKPNKPDIYGDMFGSEEKIQQSVPASIGQDYDDWTLSAPVEHIMRPLADWGTFLEDAFKKLNKGDFCHFLITSDSHVMAVELVLTEDGRKVIRFFDPNTTQTHVRTVENEQESLAHLPFPRMLLEGENDVLDYFGPLLGKAWFDSIPVTGDHSPPRSQNPADRSLDINPIAEHNINPSLIHLMAENGFAKELEEVLRIPSIRDNPTLLAGTNMNGTPALYMASQNGHTKTVQVIVDAILASEKLNLAQKMKLLLATDKNGTTGLHVALQEGHVGAMHSMVDEILLSKELNSVQKMKLLLAMDKDGTPGLHIALQEGRTEVIQAIVNTILASKELNTEQKMELLLAKDSNGTTGLYMALQEGHTDAVHVMVSAILASNEFSPKQKMKLLLAKNNNGIPGLHIALRKGHPNSAKAMAKLILLSENLISQQKMTLLEGLSEDNETVFYKALKTKSRKKFVKVMVKVIMTSTLNTDEKMQLLTKGPQNGPSALALAKQNGHAEAVAAINDIASALAAHT